jgi:hypothetical protein
MAKFSTNVNSWNINIGVCISILGILHHFALYKYFTLDPVIASFCANNFNFFG